MAHAIQEAAKPFASAIEGFMDLVKDLRAARIKRKEIRITIKELSALTNRELNDMGISRGEIYDIAHNNATRDRRNA